MELCDEAVILSLCVVLERDFTVNEIGKRRKGANVLTKIGTLSILVILSAQYLFPTWFDLFNINVFGAIFWHVGKQKKKRDDPYLFFILHLQHHRAPIPGHHTMVAARCQALAFRVGCAISATLVIVLSVPGCAFVWRAGNGRRVCPSANVSLEVFCVLVAAVVGGLPLSVAVVGTLGLY